MAKPPELREVPVPELAPGQVLVKVAGAGAYHSDLHIMQAPPPAPGDEIRLPFTLGHENAGWVETLGPRVTGSAPGDPVIVYGPWGCGLCANCREGRENYRQKTGGLGGAWVVTTAELTATSAASGSGSSRSSTP